VSDSNLFEFSDVLLSRHHMPLSRLERRLERLKTNQLVTADICTEIVRFRVRLSDVTFHLFGAAMAFSGVHPDV
jgi:hypothetical protein